MAQITYKQASELLNVSTDTIRHAVLNGKLTRCTDNLKRAMLLEEQVALFKGKRISERALSLEDKRLWERYKQLAENPELAVKTFTVQEGKPDADLDATDKEISEIIIKQAKKATEAFTDLFNTVTRYRVKEGAAKSPFLPASIANNIVGDLDKESYRLVEFILADLNRHAYEREVIEALIKKQVSQWITHIAKSLEPCLAENESQILQNYAKEEAGDTPY